MNQSKFLELKATLLRRKILEKLISRLEHREIAIKRSKMKHTEEQKD